MQRRRIGNGSRWVYGGIVATIAMMVSSNGCKRETGNGERGDQTQRQSAGGVTIFVGAVE